MVMHGDDIYVTIDLDGQQQPIAAAKSGDFDISQDFIKVCAPNSGRTFKKIPTTYDWSVSSNCLMAKSQYAKQLIDAVRNGTKYTLQFIVGGFKVVGDVYVKSCRIQTSKGSLAKLSVQFDGSEEIDTDAKGWDYINGKLYTYSEVLPGLINNTGILMMQGEVDENGVLKYRKSRPTPAMAPSES